MPSCELSSLVSGSFSRAVGAAVVVRWICSRRCSFLWFSSAAAAACKPLCMSSVDGGALYALGAVIVDGDGSVSRDGALAGGGRMGAALNTVRG